MKRLTQTKPDNCWQTCVAMLLGVEADSLPDRHAIGSHDRYGAALQTYLHDHHDLAYVEVGPELFADVAAEQTAHLMIGETVRTTTANDVWHAVVGVGGNQIWDVHPSRAGLTKVVKFGVLVPFDESWRAEWNRRVATGDPAVMCVCPACLSRNRCSLAA